MEEVSEMATSGSTQVLVAGIDFGTTYSGYAYSFKSEWQKVYINKWDGGKLMTYKTPTILLLNPDKSFNSFGYEAEKNYAEILEEGGEEGRTFMDYFYFYRFKMMLKDCLTKGLHRGTKCKDEYNREVEAMLVFKYSIEYLKDHLLAEIAKTTIGIQIDINDIKFILTVPAIWDDTAKMFMREAAIEAGIPTEHIGIALEPEAAFIYCQLMHLDEIQRDNQSRGWERKPGHKYMVIDLGGGTADIIVYQLEENRTFAEIVPASGGELGSTGVDNAYRQFLEDIFGKDTLDIMKNDPETAIDYIEFWQDFEVKKRNMIPSKQSNIYLNIPVSLIDVVKEKLGLNITSHGALLKEILSRSSYSDTDVSSRTGRLIVSKVIFNNFFEPTIDKLISLLSRIEQNLDSNVDIVFLVGGFSECELVQERLRNHLGNDRMVIPFDASLSVLKGAVYFGHRKEVISYRVARFTYGIQTWPKFDESIHSLDKKVIVDGEERCRDVFLKFVTKGDRMGPGLKKSYIFNRLEHGKDLSCGVFVSTQMDPMYVDEQGCFKLGTLTMPLRHLDSLTSSEIEETLIFGDTHLKVEARNPRTNEKYEVTIDLPSQKLNVPNSI
ncbi:heat shock 70 kDa protein 12A-like [Crassostrea virginica]